MWQRAIGTGLIRRHARDVTAHHNTVDEARAAHDCPGVQVGPDNVQVQGQVLEVVGLQTTLTLSKSAVCPYSEAFTCL